MFQLLRILCNPHIITTPIRVLKQLRAQGHTRLPAAVQNELESRGAIRHKPRALAFLRHWLAGERLTRHNGQWVINTFLPPFPGKSFDRMFENLLSGRRLSPVSAFLGVTARCTNKCWHCSAKSRRTGQLPTETWLEIIQQLHDLGASIIGFTGGEPLIYPDLPHLITAASRGGATPILFTSGAWLDLPQLKQLQRAGLWAVGISIDHPDPATHDQIRGTVRSFEQAVAALKAAHEAGLYTMIGTVATRQLVRENLLEPIWQLARRHRVQELRIMEPMPCGKLADPDPDTLLEPEDIAKLRRFHIEKNRRGRGPKVCAFNQIESPQFFGCGGGTQHLYIDSAGEVCPCDFTPLSFGNVTREPLPVIWERMNDSMGNPRRDCFIQKHHRLISQHAAGGYPLPPELSQQICAQAGKEPLPDYFALITGQSGQ